MCYIHYTVEVVGLGRQLVKHVQPSLEKEEEGKNIVPKVNPTTARAYLLSC